MSSIDEGRSNGQQQQQKRGATRASFLLVRGRAAEVRARERGAVLKRETSSRGRGACTDERGGSKGEREAKTLSIVLRLEKIDVKKNTQKQKLHRHTNYHAAALLLYGAKNAAAGRTGFCEDDAIPFPFLCFLFASSSPPLPPPTATGPRLLPPLGELVVAAALLGRGGGAAFSFAAGADPPAFSAFRTGNKPMSRHLVSLAAALVTSEARSVLLLAWAATAAADAASVDAAKAAATAEMALAASPETRPTSGSIMMSLRTMDSGKEEDEKDEEGAAAAAAAVALRVRSSVSSSSASPPAASSLAAAASAAFAAALSFHASRSASGRAFHLSPTPLATAATEIFGGSAAGSEEEAGSPLAAAAAAAAAATSSARTSPRAESAKRK